MAGVPDLWIAAPGTKREDEGLNLLEVEGRLGVESVVVGTDELILSGGGMAVEGRLVCSFLRRSVKLVNLKPEGVVFS